MLIVSLQRVGMVSSCVLNSAPGWFTYVAHHCTDGTADSGSHGLSSSRRSASRSARGVAVQWRGGARARVRDGVAHRAAAATDWFMTNGPGPLGLSTEVPSATGAG